MNAQEQADIGDHIAELEQSNVYVAYVQARKEFEAGLNERLAAAPRAEQNDLRWHLSEEWALWVKAHRVPYVAPPRRAYKPLALVGRGDNRSGPLTDG